MDKLSQEIKSFEKVWKGGFKQCYSEDRGQKKIEEFVKGLSFKRCLEIGCGHGHWSKFLNKNGELIVIDAKSKVDNDFNIDCEYYQVKDFYLNEIKEESVDLVFSYDVWCHISKAGQELYLKNLYNKLTPDGVCYIMIADPRKWLKGSKRPKHMSYNTCEEAEADADGKVHPGRWYWVGLEPFKALLKKYNYKILEDDIDLDPSAPIIKFSKSNSNMKDVIKANREVCKDINWITEEQWRSSKDLYGLPEFCFKKINEPLTDDVSYSDVIVYLINKYHLKDYLEIGISVLKNLYQVASNTDARIIGFDINPVNPCVTVPRHWIYMPGNVMKPEPWNLMNKLDLKHDIIFSDALHCNEGLQAEWDFYIKDHLNDKWIIIWDDAHANPVNHIKKHFLPFLRDKYGTIYSELYQVQEWVRGVKHPILVVSNYRLDLNI